MAAGWGPRLATRRGPVELAETDLQNTVVEMCKVMGLLCYHTHDSRRSTSSGFPDLTIVGPGGLLFRELKTARGRITADQVRWLEALRAAGQDAGVWRPDDLGSRRIHAELGALRRAL